MDHDERNARRERILDLWAEGLKSPEIQKRIGGNCTVYTVRGVIDRARIHGDKRAVIRSAVAAQLLEAEEAEIAELYAAQFNVEAYENPVTVTPVAFRGGVDSLRSVALSVALATASPRQTLTASLCGDPSPERSALGRELRPDEYASRGGEGRFNSREFILSADYASRQSGATRRRAGDYRKRAQF